MFAYDLSPVCRACAWVLVQAGRAGVGSRADVKIVSPVLSRAESRCGAGRSSFTEMKISHCCPRSSGRKQISQQIPCNAWTWNIAERITLRIWWLTPPPSTINTTLTNEWEQPKVPIFISALYLEEKKHNTASYVNYSLLFTLYLYVMYVAWD